MSFIHFILAWISTTFKGNTTALFIATGIEAFASAIFFFQIDSYGADKHHTNGLFWFLGIVFAIGAIFSIIKVAAVSGYDKSQTV